MTILKLIEIGIKIVSIGGTLIILLKSNRKYKDRNRDD